MLSEASLPGPHRVEATPAALSPTPAARLRVAAAWIAIACVVGGCAQPEPPATASATLRRFGDVDSNRLAKAEPGEWLTPGGDASGAYYSRSSLINAANVAELGFAWDYDLHTGRGQEATPVVVDGVMYTSGNWGRVYALDAVRGTKRWEFVPEMDAQWGRYACCDVVNRGVAVWKGRVYVTSLDGYLYALDADKGGVLWKADTLTARGKQDFHYFNTGAPAVAGNVIVVGSGGSDFKGARGSISAYDTSTGAMRWRFYTVPRDPKLGPQDQPHLERAAATWPKDYDWSNGGGASVWDGISYDPELDLVYFGTANPSPYVIGKDSPSGDALYAASILAVHAADGSLAWHYQEVPGDGWDYDATQKLVLTERDIGGRKRKVLMQAAKDGYLYTLDRSSGEVLAAQPFAAMNWTKGLDAAHRPLRNSVADYAKDPAVIFPAMMGAHSWQPMSVSATTGLVYIPAIDASMVYIDTSRRRAGLIEGNFNVIGVVPDFYDPKELASLYGALPSLPALERKGGRPPATRGVLRAFDPATGRVAWEQPGGMWDGGVMSTAGNLVFRGDAAGQLEVFAADSGKLLKQLDVGTAIMAAAMTYVVDGHQYVAVMAGHGGGLMNAPYSEDSPARRFGNEGRIVAFKLGGGEVPKPTPIEVTLPPAPPPREGTAAQITDGEILYNRFCSRCHLFGAGILPDLRHLSAPTQQLFYEIVLHGVYGGKGMSRWDDVLSRADAEAIHAYLIDQAWLESTQH